MTSLLIPPATHARLQAVFAGAQHSHALLFKGPIGCGALPLVRSLVQQLHCDERTACGKCHACYLSERMLHPDTHFFFPEASTTGNEAQRTTLLKAFRTFAIDQPYGTVQDFQRYLLQQSGLKEFGSKTLSISKVDAQRVLQIATHTAYQSPYKAIILWGVEHMNEVAINKLLKVIEDPPQGTYFFCISYDASALLPTLLSRLQAYAIPLATQAAVAAYVAERTGVSQEKALQCTNLSGGQPELSCTWASSDVDLGNDFMEQWLRACWRGAQRDFFTLSEAFYKKSKLEQQLVLMDMLRFFREVLLHKAQADNLCIISGSRRAFMEKFTIPISFGSIQGLIESVNVMLRHVQVAAHARMLFLQHSMGIAALLYQDRLVWQQEA